MKTTWKNLKIMRTGWIEANKEWLDTITKDHKTQQEIYYAISAEDFRHGSCGGCI